MQIIQGFDKKSIEKTVAGFKGKHIAVIGDVIVDRFIWGKVSRISPEAPVPVVKVQREELMPGGSANVISNLVSLGARVSIFGVIGQDSPGHWMRENLEKKGVDTGGLCLDRDRRTSLKTRVIANKQQVVRVDDEVIDPISPGIFAKIILHFSRQLSCFDAVIISDYFKGVVTGPMVENVNALSKELPVIVDPKVDNFRFYRDVFMITPNSSEACSFAIVPREEERESVIRAGQEIIRRLGCRHLLITRGEYGMILFENGGEIFEIPTVAREVADVSGAGDTVISVLALGIAAGADLRKSAYISNLASGIVVGKLGTAIVTGQELLAAI